MTLLSTVVLVRLVGGAEADDEDNRDANEVADGFCCCCCWGGMKGFVICVLRVKLTCIKYNYHLLFV